MSATVYIIRHGETDWNAIRRLQGQNEVPMNARGRMQVANNAEKMVAALADPAQYDFVASPIGRARETMEILRDRLGLDADDYRTDARLKELDYGEFATHTWEELRRTCPGEVMARFDNPWTFVTPRGECYSTLSRRVLSWFHSLEHDTVVTAHAGVSRVIQGYFSRHPEKDIAFLEAPQDRVLVVHKGEIGWL